MAVFQYLEIWDVITHYIMGRRSLTEEIWSNYADQPIGEQTWIVVYDFPGSKPPTKLYDNINRINNFSEGSLIQYSVYMTEDQRAAYAVRDLVKHYDGQVTVFRGTQVE